MLRNWKLLASAALVANLTLYSGFAGEQVRAGDAPKGPDPVKELKKELEGLKDFFSKKIDEAARDTTDSLRKDVGDLRKEVADLKEDLSTKQKLLKESLQARLKAIEGALDQFGDPKKIFDDLAALRAHADLLRAEMDVLKKRLDFPLFPPPSVDKAAYDAMKAKVDLLERQLAQLKTNQRVMLFPPATGRVMLVNRTAERLLFTINGTDYVVEGNDSHLIEGVPAGAITYEGRSPRWGLIRPPTTTTVGDNQTVTLTAQ